MAIDLTQRQRRWLDALIVLGTIALALVVIGLLGNIFFYFGDILLVFFLAWLLAFILSPVVSRLTAAIPVLPRVVAVVLVYTVLLGLLVFLTILVAGALATSIRDFVNNIPTIRTQLPELLAPWQRRLEGLGLGQVDLVAQAEIFLSNLNRYAAQVAEPLREIAVASLGALGNLLFILILSLYMVIDRDRIVSFLFRTVPPAFKEETRLLETSVARSFGGFLRGQAVMGLVYAFVAILTSGALQLPYLPVTSALAGFLMAIPFFGPFVAWAPPVAVAVLVAPDVAVATFVAMMVGWLLVMNVLQPRLMADAVGIHPIVVLGSVLVGSKIAGITGAIFGIPIAAVLSAFFFHYLRRSQEGGPVAERAARRLEARRGEPVRVPREPDPGTDPDVDEVSEGPAASAPADAGPARPATTTSEAAKATGRGPAGPPLPPGREPRRADG